MNHVHTLETSLQRGSAHFYQPLGLFQVDMDPHTALGSHFSIMSPKARWEVAETQEVKMMVGLRIS